MNFIKITLIVQHRCIKYFIQIIDDEILDKKTTKVLHPNFSLSKGRAKNLIEHKHCLRIFDQFNKNFLSQIVFVKNSRNFNIKNDQPM